MSEFIFCWLIAWSLDLFKFTAQQRSRNPASVKADSQPLPGIPRPRSRPTYRYRLNSDLCVLVLGFAVYIIAGHHDSCPPCAPLWMLSVPSLHPPSLMPSPLLSQDCEGIL